MQQKNIVTLVCRRDFATRCAEKLTHTGLTVNMELVPGPAGALERPASVEAKVLTRSTQCQALIHIWWRSVGAAGGSEKRC